MLSKAAQPTRRAQNRRSLSLAHAALGYALLLGLLVRLSIVLRSDFPLTDGGLFFEMVRDLQRAGYALPPNTSFNGAQLPFAYPPLAFYLTGFLSDLTSWSLFDIFRLFPAIVSTVSIAAFYLLSRSLLSSRNASLFAAFAFALYPGVFGFVLAGGGITRSLGFVFVLLALHQIRLMYTDRSAKHILLAALFAGLAALSHPEMAFFLAYSSALFFLTYGRSAGGIGRMILVGVGALAIAAPWWLSVVARHGLAPFVSAFTSGSGHGWSFVSGFVPLFTLNVTVESWFPLLGTFALLGILSCLVDKRYLLPIWLVLLFVLQPRGVVWRAIVPAALLAGIGLDQVLLPLLSRSRRSTGLVDRADDGGAHDSRTVWNRLTITVLGFTLLHTVLSALVYAPTLLSGLSRGEREAMAWIASNTPENSSFVVLTSDEWWGYDRTSEWFSVLAGRTSLATVQGYEWVGNGGLARQTAKYESLQRCATESVDCLEDWVGSVGASFDYLFIAKRPGIIGLREPTSREGEWFRSFRWSVSIDPRYRLAYDGAGATVYAKRARNSR